MHHVGAPRMRSMGGKATKPTSTAAQVDARVQKALNDQRSQMTSGAPSIAPRTMGGKTDFW